MKGLSTFPKGGIHPPAKKELSASSEIKSGIIKSVSLIPLSQHLGSPAEAVVSVGDVVTEGMLLGRASGFISANIHSPVPGKVTGIKNIYLPNGVKTSAIEIETEGEFDRLGKPQDPLSWENLSKEEILNLILEMGLVGLGGATFPLHVKYSLPEGSRVEFFIINGAECEPYLTADDRLMLEKSKEIFQGLAIAAKVLQPKEIIIGIEENKPEAIETEKKIAAECGLPVRVVPLKMKYPQGDEKQLIKAVTGREVPSGGLPLQVGCVVSNIGTLFALYEAVVYRKPLIERIVTVSGGAVKNPANLKARIGTPIGALLEECGGFIKPPAKIVLGGPMMGFTVYDLDTPVTKGTSGILALTKKEIREAPETACLQCGRCVKVCPMGLQPTRLYKLIDHQNYNSALEEGLLDCKECGCCAFACPARIPLVQGMKLGKRVSRMLKKGTK